MTTFIGIDWSEQKHDVIFMNGHGDAVLYLVVPHSADGFMEFEQKRQALGLRPDDCVVGLETAHNLLIDHLWSYEYQAYYHFCRGHQSLRAEYTVTNQAGESVQRYRKRTPAMAAGWTRHHWSVSGLILYPLPPTRA